jgi:predicted RNase H-like HicB family nuclease
MLKRIDRYTFREAWSEDDQSFIAHCQEFPSLATHGQTAEEVLFQIKTVLDSILDEMTEGVEHIPEPTCPNRIESSRNS